MLGDGVEGVLFRCNAAASLEIELVLIYREEGPTTGDGSCARSKNDQLAWAGNGNAPFEAKGYLERNDWESIAKLRYC